ncbi:MAG: CheR family methyltransferase [Nostoc sp. DedVER02]|uniref:CheR family methyltransferase n=1 Tax=unclassified Nostoc TaxID=2593658 RepID=UPI002AD4DA09|nr:MULTISPECIES: CheR family methyltransferase [unclassified Nostoc]MDZ7986250.1 CheR family methyltransferase [Nostoc sp. DedVER02]MDZ8111596.1 CheR family methyltransferase [Nostoc sp. DedVER01b]
MNILDCEQDLEALLDYLYQNQRYNFKDFKLVNLMYRLQEQMQQLQIDNSKEYLQYLQNYSQELTVIVNKLLSKSLELFCEDNSWNYLANKIIPQIISSKQSDERIRVWSVDSASGVEVYRISMLLAEALGMEQYLRRVQIFATDKNEDLLQQARRGIYSHLELADIPGELLYNYCEQTEQSYTFNVKLRGSIIFGRHDLVKNPPISKIDLLVFRNLDKFDFEIQANILLRYHFALNDNGFLWLGKPTSLSNDTQIFRTISNKHYIFVKAGNLTLEEHLLIRSGTSCEKVPKSAISQIIHFWEAAFQTSSFAQLAVDRRGNLLMANNQAETLFGLKKDNLGMGLQDLRIGQIVNFADLMRQLNRDRCSLSQKNIVWTTSHGST